VDGLLGWHAEAARVATDASPTESRPATLETWAAEDSPEADDLQARGWIPGDLLLSQYHQPLDTELDPPRVPDGYVLRTMRGPDDIPARVEVHRAAFAPSKLTVEKYEILVRQPHYAFDRDVVVEAPDGSFAAFAMGWADPLGSIGEFEPVGVHPDHQRRGLGRVVMRHGLRLLRAAGLRDAIVFSLRTNAASEALYQSAGFDVIATHRSFTKPLEAVPPIQSQR
jgi:mycothiol synthase